MKIRREFQPMPNEELRKILQKPPHYESTDTNEFIHVDTRLLEAGVVLMKESRVRADFIIDHAVNDFLRKEYGVVDMAQFEKNILIDADRSGAYSKAGRVGLYELVRGVANIRIETAYEDGRLVLKYTIEDATV